MSAALWQVPLDELPEPTGALNGGAASSPPAGDATADRATLTWAPLEEAADLLAASAADGEASASGGEGANAPMLVRQRYLRRWGATEREEEALHELWKQRKPAVPRNAHAACVGAVAHEASSSSTALKSSLSKPCALTRLVARRVAGGDVDAAEEAMSARGSAVRKPAEDVARSLLLAGGILEARKDFQA